MGIFDDFKRQVENLEDEVGMLEQRNQILQRKIDEIQRPMFFRDAFNKRAFDIFCEKLLSYSGTKAQSRINTFKREAYEQTRKEWREKHGTYKET